MTDLVFHWRKRAILGDLLRGGCGTLLCVAVVPVFGVLSPGQLAFAGLAILFGSHAAASALKLFSRVTVDGDSISLSRPLVGDKRIQWKDARLFEVRHFSLGQLRRKSLMDLKISDTRSSILLDDALDDFPTALRRLWALARAHGIGVSETTLANLAAAGCISEAAG